MYVLWVRNSIEKKNDNMKFETKITSNLNKFQQFSSNNYYFYAFAYMRSIKYPNDIIKLVGFIFLFKVMRRIRPLELYILLFHNWVCNFFNSPWEILSNCTNYFYEETVLWWVRKDAFFLQIHDLSFLDVVL